MACVIKKLFFFPVLMSRNINCRWCCKRNSFLAPFIVGAGQVQDGDDQVLEDIAIPYRRNVPDGYPSAMALVDMQECAQPLSMDVTIEPMPGDVYVYKMGTDNVKVEMGKAYRTDPYHYQHNGTRKVLSGRVTTAYYNAWTKATVGSDTNKHPYSATTTKKAFCYPARRRIVVHYYNYFPTPMFRRTAFEKAVDEDDGLVRNQGFAPGQDDEEDMDVDNNVAQVPTQAKANTKKVKGIMKTKMHTGSDSGSDGNKSPPAGDKPISESDGEGSTDESIPADDDGKYPPQRLKDRAVKEFLSAYKRRKAPAGMRMPDVDAALSGAEINMLFDEATDKKLWLDSTRFIIAQPKGGDLYFFDVSNENRDWLKRMQQDSLSWRSKNIENMENNTLVRHRASSYAIRQSDGARIVSSKFRRYIYGKVNQDKRHVVVHYIGDEKIAARAPHGHAVHKKDPHVPADHDDIQQKIADLQAQGITKPSDMMDKLLSAAGPGDANLQSVPRSLDHLRHEQQALARRLMGRKEEYKDVLVVEKYLKRFVRHCTPAPVMVYMVTKRALDEIAFICQNLPDDQSLLLYYDTTYNLGDYYMSVLTLAHPFITARESKRRNTMASFPFAYHYHTSREITTHDMFFSRIR